MPAGVSRTQDAIAPGSVPYGERANLESAISSVQNNAAPAASPAPAGAGVSASGSDPLGAMLGGELAPGALPVTDGLSVGPGRMPAAPEQSISPVHQRLIALATQAKSPHLRVQARTALRLAVRRGDL